MGKLILNGVEYSTSGNLYNPVIYSDTERRIGVWRNNKPLYQKTVSFTVTGNNNYISYSHGISDVDEIMIDMGGSYIGDYSNGFKPISAYTSSAIGFQINVLCTRTSIDYRADSNIDGQTARITVRYTKTTDTAGSGNWNTDGIPTHHYSTNEQVIGTWIDGKPLYEKCFTYSSASFSNQQMALTNDLSNVDYVVNYGGCAKEPGDNRNIPLPYMRQLANESILLQVIQLPSELVSTSLVTNTSSYTTLQNITIWVQYTKTTD